MLSKKERAPIPIFFSSRSRIIYSTDYFSVRKASNSCGWNRFGVIISTKVDSRSTARHKLKRVILGEARKWRRVSSDFVITLTPKSKVLPLPELRAEVKKVGANI